MSQQAIQEVPSTPQLGTLLMQQNEGFNQRVPSQEYYSQDDDFSLVPRTPNARFAEEQHRTPASTPASRQRTTPGSGVFLVDRFRTPTMVNGCTSSPAAQVVPGTPDCPQIPGHLRTASPAIRSPLIAAALKTPTEIDRHIESQSSHGFSHSDASTSPFLQPGMTTTPKLRQQVSKNETPVSVTPKRADLRKKVLSRNHTKLVPEKLSFDNNLCDGEENRQKTDEQLIETKRLVEGDNTLKLLHNVAHRLQEDGNETGTRQTQSRKIGLQQANQSKDSNTGNPDEDLLDIIDKTN